MTVTQGLFSSGGMRGVFTSGVLDAFMKHGLYFKYVVAVSAGACNGMSYISRQPRRARVSNIDYLARYDYIGLHHLVTQGCIFDRKLLYDKFPNEYIPFDFDTFFNNEATFEMVTTNCLTGRAEYLQERHDRQRALDVVRASSSLPYVSKIVMVDGVPMLDGGIVDSIPVMRAIETGHKNNVLILTRNKGWRNTGRDHKIPKFVYKKYPRLRVVLSRRLEAYNRQLDMIDRMEEEGSVVCIRPERPMEEHVWRKTLTSLNVCMRRDSDLARSFACGLTTIKRNNIINDNYMIQKINDNYTYNHH